MLGCVAMIKCPDGAAGFIAAITSVLTPVIQETWSPPHWWLRKLIN
ncbi:hypothetical protein O9993_05755 [Vibrio lentus]|nr:hypothetical protein [Vibrio lentus]